MAGRQNNRPHHNHGHNHGHGHGHDHDHHDPGAFYALPWVQEQLKQLDSMLKQNAQWLGMRPEKSQRILDYACGNGTVSKAFLDLCPKTIFLGLDTSAAQVARFEAEAARLLDNDNINIKVESTASTASTSSSRSQRRRMRAIQGDLSGTPTSTGKITPAEEEGEEEEWKDFDVAITSMALHHFADPVGMLRRLRGKCIMPGGAVVVLDYCSIEALEEEVVAGSKAAEEDATLNGEDMIEIHGGMEKIWQGFTPRKLKALMRAAGLTEVEVRVNEQPTKLPRVKSGKKITDGELDWLDAKYVLARGYTG